MTGVTNLLERAAQTGLVAVAISAVAGMAGVGKSALAIHVAHHLKPRFPDIQLYVNLRGGEGSPIKPFQVLGGFLRSLGIEDDFVPRTLQGRANLYRSLLVDRRAILLLDNAYDEAQVRHLLPGSPTCAVLVTSRKRLSALEGATILNLEVMSDAEALELFRRLIGNKRIQAELEAAKRIVRLCGFLPLAIRAAGGRLKARPQLPLSQHVKHLENERHRLGQLQLGDLDVRASIILSYQDLDETEAHLFRLLGLRAGVDITPEMAGSLIAISPDTAERSLERLVDAQLLEATGKDRYRFHDLIRLFAQEQLEQEETSQARQDASLRVARWHYATSKVMNKRLQPDTRRKEAQELARQTGQPLAELEQALHLEAMSWFEAERVDLIDSVRQAYQASMWELVVQLAINLANFYDIRGYWDDWAQTHQLAEEAAQHSNDHEGEGIILMHLGNLYEQQGDRTKAIHTLKEALTIFHDTEEYDRQGTALMYLGNAYRLQGHWPAAIENFEESLHIFREINDRRGEAWGLSNLGLIYNEQGRWAEAIEMFEESLHIFSEVGDRRGESQTLSNLGITYRMQSHWAKAIEMLTRSLHLRRESGDRRGEGKALNNLGNVYLEQGHLAEAIKCYELDLAICRQLGDRHGEGITLSNLGRVHVQQGNLEKGIEMLGTSLAIVREAGDRFGEAWGLRHLGNAYIRQHRLVEAIECYELDLAICRQLNARHDEGQALMGLGNVLAQQGKGAKAIEKY